MFEQAYCVAHLRALAIADFVTTAMVRFCIRVLKEKARYEVERKEAIQVNKHKNTPSPLLLGVINFSMTERVPTASFLTSAAQRTRIRRRFGQGSSNIRVL